MVLDEVKRGFRSSVLSRVTYTIENLEAMTGKSEFILEEFVAYFHVVSSYLNF